MVHVCSWHAAKLLLPWHASTEQYSLNTVGDSSGFYCVLYCNYIRVTTCLRSTFYRRLSWSETKNHWPFSMLFTKNTRQKFGPKRIATHFLIPCIAVNFGSSCILKGIKFQRQCFKCFFKHFNTLSSNVFICYDDVVAYAVFCMRWDSMSNREALRESNAIVIISRVR